MKIYKYVQVLEPDEYYGGPDEEILFYCTDENKDNKIKDYLISIINENRSHEYKKLIDKKKHYNVRVFYNFDKNILGLISDINEYFILENALILIKSNEDSYNFLTACYKGHHQFYIGYKNKKNCTYSSIKVSEEKFKSYNLSECEYSILKKDYGELYIVSKTGFNSELYYGNYDLFEKEYLKSLSYNEYNKKIKEIEKNYKLIKIKYK